MSKSKVYEPIATGSTAARDLRDRFADVVNVKDYGAKGDGVTDDTGAFAAAAEAMGSPVFVPAGSYLLTSYVAGEFYSRGGVTLVTKDGVPSDRFVIINNLECPSNALVAGGHTPFDLFSGVATAGVIAKSDQRGTGDNSRAVVQSVAYDPVNNLFFMLHLKGTISGEARYAAISRHEIKDIDQVTTKDISSKTITNVGHQGLAVEVTSTGAIKLWSSHQYGMDGGVALRFSYAANADIQNAQEYKLVDYYGTNLSLTPAISTDQRFLLVTYRVPTEDGTEYRIRVFNLKALVDGGAGDYTDDYLKDFAIDVRLSNGTRGFQGMACDGYYVYILASSTSTTQPAAIYCYTLDGQLVQTNQNVTLGFDVSTGLSSTFCEAESLLIMPVNGVKKLCLAVNVQSPFSLASGSRALYVYALGLEEAGYSGSSHPIVVANDEDNGFSKRETAFARGSSTSNGKLGGFWHYDKDGLALGAIYHQVSESNYSYWTHRLYKNIAEASYFDIQFMWYSGNEAYFLPRIGTIHLGSSQYPWQNTYCATGAWSGSDERLKDNIEDIDEAVFRAWGKVNFKVFQMKDAIEKKGEEDARLHIGVIAQQVMQAFASEGLDASRYGLFCHDEFEGSDVYGIRYSEALALECAYQRWRLNSLEAIILNN